MKGDVGEAVAQIWPARTGRRGTRGGRRALRVGKGAPQGRRAGDCAPAPGRRLGDLRHGRSSRSACAWATSRCCATAREPTQRVAARGGSIQSERADIVDRNGVVLATSVPVMSAFVNPRLLLDTAGCRAQDRLGAARAQVRGGQGEARRRQELHLDQARPQPARARPGQSPRHPRPRVPGRGAAHLSAGHDRRRTSSATPASTMPAWPASSATSTSSCRAARRCSSSIDLRLQRMVERRDRRAR